MRLTLIACLAALGLPLAAQDAGFEAAMEVQRCIWGCQRNFGMPDSAGAEAAQACIYENCGGPPETGSMSEPAPASPAAEAVGTWTYGPHPTLGVSAHVETPWGALGLACGGDPRQPASLRVSSEMFRSDGLVFVFDTPTGWSYADILRGFGPVASKDRTSCGHQVFHFQGAPRLFVVDGSPARGAAASGFAIDGPAGRLLIASGAAAAGVPDVRVIGLGGSSAAIAALLAACPAMADMGCD